MNYKIIGGEKIGRIQVSSLVKEQRIGKNVPQHIAEFCISELEKIQDKIERYWELKEAGKRDEMQPLWSEITTATALIEIEASKMLNS